MPRPNITDIENLPREKFLNALAEAYILQDTILGTTELAIISTKPDGIVNSFNIAATKLLGYESEEVIDLVTPVILHDQDEIIKRSQELTKELGLSIKPGFETLIAKTRSTRNTDRREWTYIKKNGERFQVMLSFSGIRNEKNEITGYLGIATNIAEQKKAQKQLQDSEYKFRLLAENIPGVVYLCRNDETYSMIYLNDEVEVLTGYPVGDFMEDKINFMQLYHQDDVAQIDSAVGKAIAGREKFHLQYRIRHRSGEWRWIDEVGVGVYANDNLLMLEGFLCDITDQKNADEKLLLSKQNLEAAAQELQEQNQQLNEFAHIISHNLRSPVGNIGALIGLLSPSSTLEDYQLIFSKLKLTSQSLQDTLNDLMETLRIKKEAMAERNVLSFSETLTKVKNDLAGEVIRTNAEITIDFNNSPEILYAKTYLESIFLNLLSNALKYRSPKRQPKIHFQTKANQDKVQLIVSDNGLGIDLEKNGHKLFGLRNTFHEHKEARGVGLFLTKTQVEAMGGKIWATSAVDHGTTFYIEF